VRLRIRKQKHVLPTHDPALHRINVLIKIHGQCSTIQRGTIYESYVCDMLGSD